LNNYISHTSVFTKLFFSDPVRFQGFLCSIIILYIVFFCSVSFCLSDVWCSCYEHKIQVIWFQNVLPLKKDWNVDVWTQHLHQQRI